jgi:transposase
LIIVKNNAVKQNNNTLKQTQITAQTPKESLPCNVDTLQDMVLTLLSEVNDLHGQLHYLKRQLFGKKSEKLNPNQRLLFEDMYEEIKAKIEEQDEQEEENEEEVKPLKRKRKNHSGRNPLPPELPRKVFEIEPAQEEKVCAICDTPKKIIGYEITEVLEYVPASFFVKQFKRGKFSCDKCQDGVSIGELPSRAIDKSIAGEGLLAHIITSKYADHNPLNRLEGIIRRHGVDISVSTMCDWVGRCADLLEPLVKRSRELILQSPKINTDDTSIPVKSRNRKGSVYKGYLWVYIDDKKNVVFDFTPTRSREGPKKFFGDYGGYVQADAYSGYDEFFRTGNATEVGCCAHARRKFEYALDSDPVRASHMMALWRKLYAVEKRAKTENFTPAELLSLRRSESVAVFEDIKRAVDDYKDVVLPKSPMGKAITYTLNQWDALREYTANPILEIDNNLSERTLRMVVIGRKNYLFAGSEAGAWRASIIYSLVASCKLNGIDPYAYFNDVLRKISTHPASKIDHLLPSNWNPPAKPAAQPK